MQNSLNKTPYRFFLAATFFFFFAVFPLYARLGFSGLDISPDNRLLFRTQLTGGGSLDQKALFMARLPEADKAFTDDSELQMLSAFPEYLNLVEDGKILQVQNAFGTVRIPVTGGLPVNVTGLRSFTRGDPIMGGRTEKISASRDGRWVLYLEPLSPAFARLVLLDLSSGRRTEISPRVERHDHFFPASWSPDSGFFVYVRDDRLYYYSVNSAPVDERFRLIGGGSINSILWGSEEFFYYIRGGTIYTVRSAEIFARTLYVDFLEIGKPLGNIPFEFNPVSDKFWLSPDTGSVVISRAGRNVFYYVLNDNKSGSAVITPFPYLAFEQPSLNIRVFWSPAGALTVLVPGVNAWRLEGFGGNRFFAPLSDNGQNNFSDAVISPDGSRILFWGQDGAALFDYESWRFLADLSQRHTYTGLWNESEVIIIGDAEKIERINLVWRSGSIASRDLICLSDAEVFGFNNTPVRDNNSNGHVPSPLILARSDNRFFATDGVRPWTEASGAVIRRASHSSALYRVYLEDQRGAFFQNLPMVRNLASVGTFSVIPGVRLEAHNINRLDIVICFDLYDSADGIVETLDALDRFNFKATFFMGGEFIRRYPDMARQIVQRGHEAASLFYAPIDLSDARFRVTRDFVVRGLASNEDEFFRAAGRELSLIWHPPFFASSPEIRAAAAGAGYLTVNRDFDPMDWVSFEDGVRLGLPFYSAAQIIDRIVEEAKNGALIPIRLGLDQSSRKEPLYNRLNVLFDALAREGFRVVTVSDLHRMR